MDPSIAQHHLHHHQDTLESMLVCTKSQQKEKPKPPAEQAQKCPRCDSTNTKFCYYNNYSLSQPRYFCKSCRRYWTKGGTLRNVPVGGGCRKNRRSSSSSKRIQESQPSLISHNSNITPLSSLVSPLLSYDSSDLTLAFARLQKQNNGHMGFDEDNHNNNNEFPMMGNIGNIPSVNSSPSVMHHGFLENTHNGFHNYFYGNNMNNGNMGYGENGGFGMQYEEVNGGATNNLSAAVKQEIFNLRGNDGESRVLWGFPWQIHGDGNMAATTIPANDLETSGRQSWNGFGSTWHGLINSPLM